MQDREREPQADIGGIEQDTGLRTLRLHKEA